MGKARRKVAEVEFADPAGELNEQLSPRAGATFEDDASTPRLCEGEIVDGAVAVQIHSQKERLGHYWAGALVMQLVLYTVVYSCYSKDAVTDGRAGNATSLLVQEALSDGNDGGTVEHGPPPGEMLVQFVTFLCVAYQVREIPKHIAAGKDNESEWLTSDRLADKIKAIKRLQWHQRMCFVPQPLMVMGALIASMGAAMLLSKYADCERGIMAGLAVLDATGMVLLIMVIGSISAVIACFWMTTRIHFASYKVLADSEAIADYIAETTTTPRGDSVRTIESNGLHKWFMASLCLQGLIIFILSNGTTAASESGLPGALSVSSTLFIVIGGGVFHVGCQTGALGDYYSHSRPLARSDEYLVSKRMDWHHQSMFSPLLVAVLQSFVVFPSSLSLFPFFTRESVECTNGQSFLTSIAQMDSIPRLVFLASFLVFCTLQSVLMHICVLHFKALKDLHS